MATTDEMTTALATTGNGGGIETTSAAPTIFGMLQDPSTQEQMVMAMNSEAGARRLTRVVMTEIRRNPKLGECTPLSLMGAAMMSAQLNLEPAPNGLCYLIPRKNRGVMEVNWELGYKGMIELAYRTDQIKTVQASGVCPNDFFRNRIASGGGEFAHEVDYQAGRGGEPYAFYGFAEMVNGGWTSKVLTIEEINDEHRAKSESFKWAEKSNKFDSPWHTNPNAMRLKTAMRVLWTWLPKTQQMLDAAAADSAVIDADLGEGGDGGITVTRNDLADDSLDDELESGAAELPAPAPINVTEAASGSVVTVGALIDAAKDHGHIPQGAKEPTARKALMTLVNDATGQTWGVLDDAAAAEGEQILAWITANPAQEN